MKNSTSLLGIIALALGLYTAQPVSAALVFEMDFNDADGNQSLMDRGTTGVTGSFGGNATYSTDVAPVNSGGYSGSFSSAGDVVNFGDINALDGLTSMTITAWIKADGGTSGEPGGDIGSGRIVTKRVGNTGGFDLYYHNSDNEMEFVADGAGNTVFNGGGAIAVDQWVFLAVTWTGGTATFYTGDGTTLSAGQVDTGTAQTLQASAASLLLGNSANGDRSYQGLIDNVRIYDRVEDSASLQSIMQFNDGANSSPDPTVTLSTVASVVDSAYTVDVTFSRDVSGLEASDFVITNGTASSVSPAAGPASTYTVTITPTDLLPATVSVQLPTNSVSDDEGLPNRASNILSTTAIAPDGPEKPITVRVAAYNVEFGKSATPEEIGALLLPYNLDIIGFNEAPDGDWTDRVGAVLGMEYSFVGQISSANHVDKYKSILSRTPLEVTNEFELINSGGWNPASAVRARTKIDGNSVAFYSLHISNRGTTDSHAYQLATEVLPLETVDRVIVVGDFNNNIGDFNINAIEDAGFEATWTDLNIDVTQEKTYDAQDPNTSLGVIDHIFFNTSSGARVTDGEIIEEVSPLSDHKPIWAEIAFPEGISILNPGFESDVVADGGNLDAITGWTIVDGSVWVTDRNGGLSGDPGATPDADDGEQLITSDKGDIYQVLSATLEANATYTLTVDVGDRDLASYPGTQSSEIRLGTGSIFGANLLTATVVANTAPDTGWETWQSTFTTGEGDGVIGEALRIELINHSDAPQVLWDNVRLALISDTPPDIIMGGVNDGGDIVFSWDTNYGQSYNVETNADLTVPSGWGTFTTIVGDGSPVSVTNLPVGPQLFYKVTSDE